MLDTDAGDGSIQSAMILLALLREEEIMLIEPGGLASQERRFLPAVSGMATSRSSLVRKVRHLWKAGAG